MTSYEHVEKELVQGLLEALEQLPQSRVRLHEAPSPLSPLMRGDAAIELHVDKQRVLLIIEAKRAVYPRDVREFLWQLRNYAAHFPHRDQPVIPVLAAQALSPGAREILREEKAGYFDAGGSLYLSAPGLYIYVDKPPAKGVRNPVRALFVGKRADVLQALFHRAKDWVGVHEIAELIQVSPTTVSQTFIELERLERIETKGAGPSKERRLADPGALLDIWAKHSQLTPLPHQRRYYVPNSTVEALAERLDRACEEHHANYVLTLEAAAQRYTPYLSSISRLACRFAPAAESGDALAALDARVVSEGANLIVLETPTTSEFLFKERSGSSWLANPVQIYLDLLRAGGRAKEMANHLRQERIGF